MLSRHVSRFHACQPAGRLLFAVAITLATSTAGADNPEANADQAQVPPIQFARTPAETQILGALQTRLNIKPHSLPLTEFVDLLRDAGQMNLIVDRNALDEEGILLDTEVTGNLNDVTIEAAIKLRLQQRLGLTWYIDGEVLHISTETQTEEMLETRVFDIEPLRKLAAPFQDRLTRAANQRTNFFGGQPGGAPANPGGTGFFQIADQQSVSTPANPIPLQLHQFGGGMGGSMGGGGLGGGGFGMGGDGMSLPMPEPSEHAWLLDYIQQHDTGLWMDIDGTGGSLSTFGNVLVVRNTLQSILKTEYLLNRLLKVGSANSPVPTMHYVRSDKYAADRDQKIETALNRSISLELHDVALADALHELADRLQISIVLDETAITDEGIDTADELATLTVQNLRAEKILALVLEPLYLKSYVDHGVLIVTSEPIAAERLQTALFDVSQIDVLHDTLDGLSDLIMESTPGPWMDYEGAGGTISFPLPTVMSVSADRQNLRAISKLLVQLHQQLKSSPKKSKRSKANRFDTRIYRVTDAEAAERIVELLPLFVDQSTWAHSGSIARNYGDRIVVRANDDLHGKIAEFIKQLERGAEPAAAIPVPPRIRISPTKTK